MQYQTDPLAEKKHEVLPGLIWKYKNRVLLLTTYECPTGCAFCFRKKLNNNRITRASNKEIVSFVNSHKEIQEIIFSGGEPLTRIDDIISITRALRLPLLRIHTRLPVVFPKKTDKTKLKQLIRLTDKPVYMVLHINHPQELASPLTRKLIIDIRKMGYILLSHTVFLKKINDDETVLSHLFNDMIGLGIKPYYIFHCDSMSHTRQYIVALDKEISIMSTLRKHLSGIALPTHIIDSSSGNGKIPVPPDFWSFEKKKYRDFEGVLCNV